MVAVLVALPALIGFAALSIDVGYMLSVRTQLQAAADAAALAAVTGLPDEAPVRSLAAEYAERNDSGHSGILDQSDVEIGNFDPEARVFTQAGNPPNAVRVSVERSDARGNPVELRWAYVLGLSSFTVGASATAYSASSGPGTKFLVDQELIDTDIPAIEELADSLNMDPEELISDNDGDWFIDLPPGAELTLPTGQEGDEGIFDISHPSFPFTESSSPSYEDFLNFNEDGSWRQNLVPKHMLDPLVGVTPVTDPDIYDEFVNPDFCNVSPIFKSDISDLGNDEVNALGERRGLLSFKLIAVGLPPSGCSSCLPDIVIRICEPGDIGTTNPPSGFGSRHVLVE